MARFRVGDVVKYRSGSMHMVIEVTACKPAAHKTDIDTFEGILLETDRDTYSVGDLYGYYSEELFDVIKKAPCQLEEKWYQALDKLESSWQNSK